MSCWKYLEDFPPPMVRILARRSQKSINTVPLTDEEIALVGDLPLVRVREIMFSDSWDDISLGEVRKFLSGCRFDPTNYDDRHRALGYAKKGKYKYWVNSPLFHSHFLPLNKRLREMYHVSG